MTTLLLRTLAATTAAVACASAQDPENCTRPEFRISSGNVSTSAVGGFNSWRTAAPKQSLPGDTTRGLAPTAQCVYTIHPDWNQNQQDIWSFRRSRDGGATWGPPVEVWTADFFNGETIDTPTIILEADGHAVFAVFETNRNSAGNPAARGRMYSWVLASDDQGQTWQSVCASPGVDAPLSTNVQIAKAGETRAALADGRLHLVFATEYRSVGGGSSSPLEDVYYQAVEFDSSGTLSLVFPEERNLESIPPGTIDSDEPEIAADGGHVIVTFKRDDSGINDSYSVVSTDGGATWSGEHDHTNLTVMPSLNRRTRCAVDGDNMYVVLENNSLNNGNDGDDVQIDVSNDRGVNWSGPVLISRSPAGIDSDRTRIAAGNGKVFVFYEDDRDSNGGNGDNDIYCVVDVNAGADFLADTHPEYKIIDTDQDIVLFGIDAVFEDDAGAGNGDHVAVSAETSDYPEDNSFVVTSDDGAHWQRFDPLDNVTRRTNYDTDDLDLSITVNRDVTVIYQHDSGGGNNFNNVYVAGARTPHLIETANGFQTVPPAPQEAFEFALLLPSLQAPTPTGLAPPGALTGVAYDFTPDALTLGALGNVTPFLANVDIQGTASWQMPNFAALIGQPIYWMSARIGSSPRVLTRAFTDTIAQR